MSKREILSAIAVGLWLLVGAAALLMIALSFPLAADHPDLAGALIGAAGTIFAGWLAFHAAQRGIEWNERTRRADAIRRDVAVCDAVSSELLMLSRELSEKKPPAQVSAFLGTIARGLLLDVTRIDGHLGVTLQALILELDAHREIEGTSAMDPRWRDIALPFAFRAYLLAIAFNNVAHMIERGEPPTQPFFDASNIATAAQQASVGHDADQGYVRMIGLPRQ